jgi:XTP/dITP diphosphohydrolase/tetrapyrrole methylase family protein/MazG family protein
VLIQVVFHALLAEEGGHFNFDDVARDINEKLIRRHPHVFGTGKLDTSEQVLHQWDIIKAGEKKHGPVALTSSRRARKSTARSPPAFSRSCRRNCRR